MTELLPGKYRRIIVNLWRSAIGGISLLILYILAVRFNFLWLFGPMPDLVTLENPKFELASELISEDNQSLGKYFIENRAPVEHDQISPRLIEALLATEDARFVKHSGIDARSLVRVVKGVMTGQTSSGGGSTLTQQVAKNLFRTRTKEYRGALGDIPGLKIVINKTKEWILSVVLERKYTKKEIMMMYLNTVSFGNNTYGIKVAARTYFNKDTWDLNVTESALLVGLLQNPTFWNPLRFPDRALQRRNTVLAQMNKYGFLTDDELTELKERPLGIEFTLESHITGPAPYFREVMKGELRQWLEKYNADHGTSYDLFTSGLRIYTTIDARLQKHMEEALWVHMKDQQAKFDEHWKGRNPWIDRNGNEIKGFLENAVMRTPRFQELKRTVGEEEAWKVMKTPYKMKVFTYDGEKEVTMSPMDSIAYYKRFLRAGMMSIDPNNGHIKAWAGGVNFKYFKYDHVKQGKRQPGSTFKPFVYLAALDRGILTPCSHVIDQPIFFGPNDGVPGGWSPKNSSGTYSYESLPLRQALANSVNSVSAFIIKQVGAQSVVDYAHKVGINSPLEATPSLCLGISDVSVYEMVGAYSTFANGGNYTEPMAVTRIEDRYGNVLQEFYPKTNQQISANMAYNMIYLMRGAVEGGTSSSLGRFGVTANNEIAAKTGTTQNQSDGWFMGITQNLVTGVWVGGEDRSIHFRTLALGQGARTALPAWGLYMQKVYADPMLTQFGKGPFRKPENYFLDCGGPNYDAEDTYTPTIRIEDEGLHF
ncbi:MAG: transglycosylase domain-containing protein [Spirosomataceae bacterium]